MIFLACSTTEIVPSGHKPSNPSTSRSTPDTQNDTSRGSPEAHPRNSPQQWVPPPSTVQGGGGSSLVADSYVGMHQSTPTVPEVYESAQGIPFPVTMIATTSTPQDAQYQVPTLGLPHGSSSLRMRSSEVGNVLDTQNVQKFDVRTQYPIGNQRPVPTAYTPNTPNKQWSGPSPVTSRTQYPSAGTAKVDMIPGMSSSQMHLGSVTSQNHLDTFSGLQDNVYDCSPIVLGPASSGALHQIEDQNPPQGTSSMVPESPRKKRRTGGRKRPALENQPIPSAYPGWSGASQATTLGAQYPAAAPSHMVPGLSSHTHAVAFPPVVDSCPSPSSSGLKDDLHGNDGIAPLISGSVSNGDLSQTEDYDLSQQGASPAASSERRKVRRAGKRKRKDDPKDKKGTERLRDQRQADADNLEKLCEILGAPEAQKKDLFAICTSQSSCLSWTMDECCQWLCRLERCGAP